MIANKPLDWQQALAQAVTDPTILCQHLDLDPESLGLSAAAHQEFSLKVPLGFIARMEKGNPKDPLLLQVLPNFQETILTPGFNKNPINEQAFNPIPGLLHKYHGRVLLTLTGACAINCRFCFRRHFPYQQQVPGVRDHWPEIYNYISQDSSINEVILSGGDPLLMKDTPLSTLVRELETIPHLTQLRIHSRLPIVLPERITDSLLHLLKETRLQSIMVTHCNHPAEIDDGVIEALQKLRENQITLFNQSVLLKDINNSAETLIQLSKKLFQHGVLPYYLHLLDPVQGSAHFDVDDKIGKKLIAEMSAKLPGYLVPKLVREIPGEKAKTLIR